MTENESALLLWLAEDPRREVVWDRRQGISAEGFPSDLTDVAIIVLWVAGHLRLLHESIEEIPSRSPGGLFTGRTILTWQRRTFVADAAAHSRAMRSWKMREAWKRRKARAAASTSSTEWQRAFIPH